MAIGRASHFLHADEVAAFLHAAVVFAREAKLGPVRRDGLVGFVHTLLAKQRLVRPPVTALGGQQYQPGRVAVNAVDGGQVGQAQLIFQLHQQGVLDVAAAGGDGQKVRLVGHDQVGILVQHLGPKRHGRLVRCLAVVVDAQAGQKWGFWGYGAAPLIDHFVGSHALQPVAARDGRQALAQKIQGQALALAGQHHAAGFDPIF